MDRCPQNGLQTSNYDQNVAGYAPVLQQLLQILHWPVLYRNEGSKLGIQWPRGCLLHGPPGVGKTHLVKAAVEQAQSRLFTITPADVVGSYLGESEARLRSTFELAQQVPPSQSAVIFIDELDTLCPRRGHSSAQEGRIVAQLLTLLDGTRAVSSNVQVVAATNRPEAVDSALRRPGRLDTEIAVLPPTEAQRLAILHHHTRSLPLAPQLDLLLVAQRCQGYTAADIAALCREAAMLVLTDAAQELDLSNASFCQRLIDEDDFWRAMVVVRPSIVRGLAIDVPELPWDGIGGLEGVKMQLRQAVEWPLQRRDAFERLGLEAPHGVLLYGPPGCSKTSLVRAVATSSKASVVTLSASQLYSMYLGEGEALLRQAFQRARMSAPTIVFLDDIDAMFTVRTAGSDDRGASQLLAVLLTEMDGLELAPGVVVIAATNRPWSIDSALLRPGRFDMLLHVPLPDTESRLQALHVHTSGLPLAADVSLNDIAERTEGLTGAEVSSVCRVAALAAAQRNADGLGQVTSGDFWAALQGVDAGVSTQAAQQYEEWAARHRK